MVSRKKQRLIQILTIIAILLSVVFTGRGLFLLGVHNEKPNDLALRWRELRYVQKGVNPYDLSDFLFRKETGLPPVDKPVKIDPELGGTSIASGYPPWAFLWSAIFIPPVGWTFARLWFFGVNLAALTVIAIFAWKILKNGKPLERLFVVSCVLSANSIGTTFGNGQWGIILCALLILITYSLRQKKTTFPGFMYAVVLLKPTFGFAFAPLFARNRSWISFVLAGLLTTSAWILVTGHVGSRPIEMLHQMLDQTAKWKDCSYSIPDAVVAIGLPRSLVVLGCLGAGVIIAWRMVTIGPDDPTYQLAVCGTIARIFSYHQLYDNVLIIFLVAAIAKLFLERDKLSDIFVMLAVLISIWIPGRFTSVPLIQIFQLVSWAGGLFWLANRLKKNPSAPISLY
jgi:hypothetical protein